jgi:tetratricopeptide (TPR) repeat protein
LYYFSGIRTHAQALNILQVRKWVMTQCTGFMLLLQGNKVPSEAEQQAAEHYNRGEYDRAEAVFKLLIECFKDYAEGYNYLGLIALAKENLQEAISNFGRTMKMGRKLFPPNLARRHYWSDLSTRPYMRGMKNMILALIRAGHYDNALSYCDRLEKECGDEITANSYRADIYLNTALIHEYEELAKKKNTQNSTHRGKVINRLRRIRSFEFAQQEAEKLGEEINLEIFR